MLKLKSVKTGLIGRQMPRDDAARGVFIHNYFESEGWPLNRGPGADFPEYAVELKSRRINATSGHTIGSMNFYDLCTVPFKDSLVAAKLQYQIRVTVDENSVVTAVDVYDFTPDFIQDMVKTGYEEIQNKARKLDVTCKLPDSIYGTQYCYAELHKDTESYKIRLSKKAMINIINASTSTFRDLVIYG
jgi:hypothetical protein